MDKGPLNLADLEQPEWPFPFIQFYYLSYNMINKDIFSQIIMALNNAVRALHNMSVSVFSASMRYE